MSDFDLRRELRVIRGLAHLILDCLEKEHETMSALTDAVSALTAAKASEETELGLVLDAVAAFPQKITDAVNAAIAAGADPATLAGIQAATAEIAADQKRMADALAAPPPAG